MTRLCESRLLPLVTYENGMAMQETLVALRQHEAIPDQLLLLEHTPVITLGRGGKAANLLATGDQLHAAGVKFHETTRGGDITYHGPGQLVGYPILHLGEGNRDIRRYVTNVEEALIRTLREYGIEASRWEGNRGVWLGRQKIAAIGVRISRWVTSHGFALNVDPDLDHFRLITPCGLAGTGVTSIRERCGAAPAIDEVAAHFERHFAEVFQRDVRRQGVDMNVVKVIVHDDERVLLLRRLSAHGGFWQPVTGRVEEGETFESAAARELLEETGRSGASLEPLDFEQAFLIDAAFLADATRPQFAREVVFSSFIDSSQPLRLAAEEHDAYGWFTFAEAYEKIRWSDDREALERLERRLAPAAGRA